MEAKTGNFSFLEKLLGLKRENKLFLVLGIPLWILNIILLYGSVYPVILVNVFLLILLSFIFLYQKKIKERYAIPLMKVGILLFAILFINFYSSVDDPSMWVDQYKRDVSTSLLLTPEDEYVLELKDRFDQWLSTNQNISTSKYSYYVNDGQLEFWSYKYHYQDFTNINWVNMDTINRSLIIDWYINEYIVEWTADSEVYGVSDYKATPHEILQQNVDNGWTAPAKDDCDGIAVVTISLMKAYGIDAYIGKGKGHWFTVLPSFTLTNQTLTDHGLIDGQVELLIFNSWENIHIYSYFNEDEFHIAQSPFISFFEILYIEDESNYDPIYTFIEENKGSFYLLIIIASILLPILIGYPRDYSSNLHEEECIKRNERRRKIYEIMPWVQIIWNPLNWILYPLLYYLYIRNGNPFRKVYMKTWINILLTLIFLIVLIEFMLKNQGNLGMYFQIKLISYIFVYSILVERDYFPRVIDGIINLKNKNLTLVDRN